MKICSRCNNKIGLLTGRLKLRDGILCSKCKKYLMSIGANDLIDVSEQIKYEKLCSIIEHKEELNRKFDAEHSVGDLLQIYYVNKIIKFDDILLDFSNIAGVEAQENWEQNVTTTSMTKKKGGITRGLIGGVLFGGIGALAGVSSAKNKTVSKSSESTNCSSVTLTIMLKDYYKPYMIIDLDPTYTELKKAQCANIQTYALAVKKSFEQIIENLY